MPYVTKFAFTWFGPIESFREFIEEDPTLQGNVYGIVFQEEICPTTGKKHVQGFLQTVNRKRAPQIKKLLNKEDIHVEAVRNPLGS